MANDGTKITGIVRILGDLQPVLGTNLTKLGQIIAGKNVGGQYLVNINKWSLYKPFRNPALSFATSAERQAAIAAAHAGFGTTGHKECNLLLQQSYFKQSGGATSYTEEQCLTEVLEWGPYLRPSGTLGVQPFRQIDFRDYNHAAIAPDRWLNKSLTLQQLTSIAESNITVQGSRGNHVFVPGVTTCLYEGVRCKITPSVTEGGWISPDSNMEIPIASITGSLIENNDWRFAAAVWMPSRNEWGIFPARKSIYSVLHTSPIDFAYIFPDFGCNPSACNIILSEYNNGRRSWDIVPIFVQNIGATVDNNGKNVPCLVVGASQVYCMPSGTKTTVLEVQSGKPKKFFVLRSETGSTATSRNWYVKNTDTMNSHVYEVYRVTRQLSTITSESYTPTMVAANTEITLGMNVPFDMYGTNVTVSITARDGIPVSELED